MHFFGFPVDEYDTLSYLPGPLTAHSNDPLWWTGIGIEVSILPTRQSCNQIIDLRSGWIQLIDTTIARLSKNETATTIDCVCTASVSIQPSPYSEPLRQYTPRRRSRLLYNCVMLAQLVAQGVDLASRLLSAPSVTQRAAPKTLARTEYAHWLLER